MNHTGVWSTGSPRQACRKALTRGLSQVRHVGPAQPGVRPTIEPVGVRNQIEGTTFAEAVDQLTAAALRPEVAVDDIPAPQRIAPHAHAISGDVVTAAGDEIGTGRFILLHDPAGNDAWDGTFRCVTFARADIESDMAADPSLPSVGWTWLTDALDAHDAQYHAFSGSVTVVHTEGFGEMAADGASAQVELRASWTPGSDVGPHVAAWSDLLCALAGLPPLAPGVIPLPQRRLRSR